MANQMIALQSRNPQLPDPARLTAQYANMMNTAAQQRAAQLQGERLRQEMEFARAGEAREAELQAPRMAKAQAEADAGRLKYVMDYLDTSALALANSRNPQQAMALGDRMKQMFPEPELQQAIDETLASIPQDPGQFEAWREDSLFRTMESKDQLSREFKTQTTGTEQREISMPKYGHGAATEVPGSRIDVAEGMTYVKDDQGNVFAMPSKSGGGFATPAPSMGASGGGDVFSRMIKQESGGNQFAKSGKPLTSPKGAIGIAQVMPGTAPEAAKLAGLEFDANRYRTDKDYNLALGKAYYEKQLADFGDERLAAAAYNAGPGAVRRALAKGGPDGWINNVPRETREYINSVFGGGNTPASAPRGAAPAAGGGKTPVIKGTAPAKARSAALGAKSKYDNTIAVARRLLKNPALNGILGNIQGNVPETALSVMSQDAADALSDYNNLLTIAGFQELQTMRDNSPTGGALGQVSDSENKMLQQSAFASSRTQSEAKFRRSLLDYIARLEGSRDRVLRAYEDQFGERIGGAAAKPAPTKTKTKTPTSTLSAETRAKYGL